MANPFESLITASQDYAQKKAASDPFALISQGLASTPIQVSNPWVNLASNLGRGLVAGGLSSVAGRRQEGIINDANSQLYGHVLGGQALTNQELAPYAQQVKGAFMADAYENSQKEARTQAAFQRALLQNQLGTLYGEAVKAEMSPENQSARARGLPVVNPAMSAYEQKIQAIAGKQPSDGRAAAMPEPRLSATTAPVTMQEIQQQIGTGAARPNIETPSAMQQTTSPFPPPPNPNDIKNIRTMDDALRVNSNPILAKELLEEATALRKEDREDTKINAPIEKEKRDYIASQSEASTKTRRLIAQLNSEITMAGQTGNYPFDPGIEQMGRETNLMMETGKDKERAKIRLQAMQRMDRSALDLAAEIKKSFPGNPTEREMVSYLAAGISKNNIPEKNQAVVQRMVELQTAADAANAFIFDKMDKGMSKAAALRAYNEYDAKTPLFIQSNTGQLIINPERLKTPQLQAPQMAPAQGGVKTNTSQLVPGSYEIVPGGIILKGGN